VNLSWPAAPISCSDRDVPALTFNLPFALSRLAPHWRTQSSGSFFSQHWNVSRTARRKPCADFQGHISRRNDVDLMTQVIKSRRRSKNISTQSGTETSSFACWPMFSKRRTACRQVADCTGSKWRHSGRPRDGACETVFYDVKNVALRTCRCFPCCTVLLPLARICI